MNARPAIAALALALGCGSRSGLHDPDPLAPPTDAPAAADAADETTVLPDVPEDIAQPDVPPPPPDLPPPPPDVPVADVAPDRPPLCGNGVREAREECDLGSMNALVPAFALSQPGRPEVPVRPLARRLAAAAFYRYESASAHTGFELTGTANAFLYVNAVDNDLALFFFAGRDADDGTLPAQGDGDMEFFFRGVPSAARVVVSDDSGEFARQASGDVRGNWGYNGNTDGGVLAGMPWSSPWRVVIEGGFRAGTTSLRYVDGDGRPRPLALREAVVLEHRTAAPACRPDCVVPRCGDGFLDAGERCDDGNARSGDGCAGDCQRIE